MKTKNMKECVSLSMVQTGPLPGSYRNTGEGIGLITEKALSETQILHECGFDGIILQNMGDMPILQHSSPEAIAYLTVVGKAIKDNFPDFRLGILVNWDGVASLAIADAIGADFVRVEHVYTGVEVTSAGLIYGQCCEITALKRKLMTQIPVYADVYEPHAVALGAKPIEDAAWESVNEAFAEGLFLSGKTANESIDMVNRVRKRVPGVQLYLGGGANGDNVYDLLQYFDGVCVASWIKNGNMRNPVDKEKAKIFIDEVNRAKSAKGLI